MTMKGLHSLKVLGAVCLLISITRGFECDESAKICETSLVIDHFLTMTHREHGATKLVNGKLYKNDVTNVTTATPIPLDEVITVDGQNQRLVIVANDTLPGPPIIVYEGQTVVIHVINKMLSETVTVHWHGLYQRGTPYSDGPAYVTQCPIQPLQKFTYKFVADPVGTHWYHSHVGFQRTNGLFGAFIVRKRGLKVHNEHILQIQDWNHNWLSERDYLNDVYGLEDKVYAITGEEFPPILATSGLINGKGRFHTSPGVHNSAPLEIFKVDRNETHRFRIINTGANFPFRLSIDGHMLTVVASDGHDLQPVTAQSVIVFPGERFDVTITTDQPVDNYWIRGETLESTPHRVEAILRYMNASDMDPITHTKNCTDNSKCVVVNCLFKTYPKDQNIECVHFGQMKSAIGSDPAPAVTDGQFEEYFLNFGVPGEDEPHSINGIEFQFPNVNALSHSSLINTGCEKQDCGEQKICTCTHFLNLKHNNTVQLVLLNMGTGALGSHPIHMHGHSFQVLKMSYANLNKTNGQIPNPDGQIQDIDCRGGVSRSQSYCTNAAWSNSSWSNGNIPGLELTNAPLKDTIVVPSGGYIVVRIKADNPGMWFMHCHIEVHGATGMAMILNESFPNIPLPPAGFPECYSFEQDANTVMGKSQLYNQNDDYEGPTGTDTVNDEDTVSLKTFIIVTAVLAVVVCMQFVVNVCLCRRKSTNKTKELRGTTNVAYVSK